MHAKAITEVEPLGFSGSSLEAMIGGSDDGRLTTLDKASADGIFRRGLKSVNVYWFDNGSVIEEPMIAALAQIMKIIAPIDPAWSREDCTTYFEVA